MTTPMDAEPLRDVIVVAIRGTRWSASTPEKTAIVATGPRLSRDETRG